MTISSSNQALPPIVLDGQALDRPAVDDQVSIHHPRTWLERRVKERPSVFYLPLRRNGERRSGFDRRQRSAGAHPMIDYLALYSGA